jgi:TonB family protein
LVQNAVLWLTEGPGWIHTQKMFADFVLRFDVRVRGTQPAFSILARAVAGKDAPSPVLGYGIAIDRTREQNQPSARVLVFPRRIGAQEVPLAGNVLAEWLGTIDAWQAMELTCASRECTLSVNSGAAARITRMEVPLGYIGFAVAREAVELRNIRVRRIPPIRDGFAHGAHTIDDEPDLIAPRVQSERRPRYTPGAMAARIQGAVLLACLINEDGTVSEEIALLRSLDSELDREAMLAAREWRFTPATLRGQPVRALVTIELTFTLGR